MDKLDLGIKYESTGLIELTIFSASALSIKS